MMQFRKGSPWLAEALAGVLVNSGIGYWLACYTVSRWLTRPCRGKPKATPESIELPFENVECRTKDGHRLAGWVMEPASPRGTVALFHGLRHNRAQTLPRVLLLVQAGYRCIAFDHRAHGQSTGRTVSFGFREAHDVEAVFAYARERWPGDFLAGVGISMGAAALCFAAGRMPDIDACCLESLYHDVASAFQKRIGTKFPSWFGRFARGAICVTERRLGIKLAEITPADRMNAWARVPLLLLTGTDDLHATPQDAERLLKRCRGPAKLVLIDGADHANLCVQGGQAYRSALLDFLSGAQHLAGKSALHTSPFAA